MAYKSEIVDEIRCLLVLLFFKVLNGHCTIPTRIPILCIVEELAGGGSVAIGDKEQMTCDR